MATSDALRHTRIPSRPWVRRHPGCRVRHADTRSSTPPEQATRTALEVGISAFRLRGALPQRRSGRRCHAGGDPGRGWSGGRISSSPRSCGTPTIVPSGSGPHLTPAGRRLQIDEVDCYLIHTPFAFRPGDEQDPRDERGQVALRFRRDAGRAWGALERLVDDGRCKAIGLSDITLEKLREIIAVARIKPAVVPSRIPPLSPRMGVAGISVDDWHCPAGVCRAGAWPWSQKCWMTP